MPNANGRLAGGFALVAASMVALFTVPPGYFVAATFVSTSCMLIASYLAWSAGRARPSLKGILAGLVSAALLYAVFYSGNAAVNGLHPFGLSAASEASIYSLIASPSNPLLLQLAVLAFDAAGYESFFRGVLQTSLAPEMGVGSAPAVAAIDAAFHIITLNPLWVATTFVADLAWGLTYRYSGLTSSFTSHLVWDVCIFVLFPIR